MIRRWIAVGCLLALGATALSAQTERPTPRRGREGSLQRLEARVAQLKTAQAELVAKLKEVQQLIKGNKLEEAVEACQTLLDMRAAVHEEELKTLERQLDYLRRVNARNARAARRIAVGQRAHLFQARSLTGETVNLQKNQGKIIVLEWINFDCPFSRYYYKNKKTFIELANRYQSQGVVWVAVNSTQSVTDPDYPAFLKSIGVDALPYPVIDDHEGKIGRAYGAKVTPQIMIIDTTGKVAYSGAVDNAPQGKVRPAGAKIVNYVDRALTELLSGRPVSTLETEPMGCTVKYASPRSGGAVNVN